MGVWCAGVGVGGGGAGAVSGRALWCGGVCRGLVGSVLGGGRVLGGSAEGPSLLCRVQSEHAEARDVGGCGQQVEVGVDFGPAAHAGVAAAVFSAHEVRELAFDFGAHGAVVVSPWRGPVGRARDAASTASLALMRTVRPPAAPVQRPRSAHSAQAAPNAAVPEPSPRALMATVVPAGQVTVPLSKSTSKRSLVKRPPGAAAGWVRHLELMRLC